MTVVVKLYLRILLNVVYAQIRNKTENIRTWNTLCKYELFYTRNAALLHQKVTNSLRMAHNSYYATDIQTTCGNMRPLILILVIV